MGRNKIRFILAPMGTGKTTFSSKHAGFVFDDDGARDPALEPRLKELRTARDWRAHNELWHSLLAKWVKTIPHGAVITAHSFDDARAMGATRHNTIAVLLHPDVWRKQLASRDPDARTRSLANDNRAVVIHDVALNGLDCVNSWDMLELIIAHQMGK